MPIQMLHTRAVWELFEGEFFLLSSSERIGVGIIQGWEEFKEIWYIASHY